MSYLRKSGHDDTSEQAVVQVCWFNSRFGAEARRKPPSRLETGPSPVQLIARSLPRRQSA
jgi:hypothetical protein